MQLQAVIQLVFTLLFIILVSKFRNILTKIQQFHQAIFQLTLSKDRLSFR